MNKDNTETAYMVWLPYLNIAPNTFFFYRKKDVDVLIASGKLAKNIYRGFKDGTGGSGRCFYFRDNEALTAGLKDIIKPGDIILVKGSRGNKLEDIVTFLLAE